jgi:hypothetical protein
MTIALLSLIWSSIPQPPLANAETTDVVVIGCEFIASAIDGNTTDVITDGDVQAACGGDATGSNAAGFGTALPPTAAPGVPSVANLAKAIGDEDGALEASDFRGEFDENWDNNQVSADCRFGGGQDALDFFLGMACTLDVFVFVDDESPTKIDLPSGLETIENTNLDFMCTTDVGMGAAGAAVGGGIASSANATPMVITTTATHGLVTGSVVTIAGHLVNTAVNGQWRVTVLTANTFSLDGSVTDLNGAGGATGTVTLDAGSALDVRFDNDCADGTVPALGTDTNGDGVVLFHVLVDSASAGDVKMVNVEQEAVAQAFDINVVGRASNVELTLAESLIETNGNTANVTACQTTTPVTGGIAPPTSTLARAVATDLDGTELTRVPVFFKVTPPEDTEIAKIGLGVAAEGVTSNTFFSLDPTTPASAPNAAYAVICGGKETGTATIDAAINLISCTLTGCSVLSSQDHGSKDITVGGAPSSNVLTAEPSTIKCDGTEVSTVTAKVTDPAGSNVADGVPVNFSVVALGTANPINTVTKDGKATSVITPLSNLGAGVTVIVSAGDSDIASIVQTSIRVDCNGFDTDGDGDGIADAFDNCPLVANSDQLNTDAANTALNRPGADAFGDACDDDIDGDGYTNVQETTPPLVENMLLYCDIMRANLDGDHAVTILDMTVLAGHFLDQVPPAPERDKQDADNAITILDLAMMANLFLDNVSACP